MALLTRNYYYKGTCIQCGSLFSSTHQNAQHCSNNCRGLSRRKKHEHGCLFCKGPLTSKQQKIYCSRDCSQQDKALRDIALTLWEEALVACKGTGSVYKYLARFGYSGHHVRGAMAKHGWKIPKRPKAPPRATGKLPDVQDMLKAGCLLCGEKRAVDACHIIPHRWGGANKLANMMPLCPTHHKCYDQHLLTDDEKRRLKVALLLKQQVEPSFTGEDVLIR